MSDGLLTARQLMARLAELGVGQWSADAARQWVREEPGCPSEPPLSRGQPRRYRLDAVLHWLRARCDRVTAKSWNAADGTALADRIDAASDLLSGHGPVKAEQAPREPARASKSGESASEPTMWSELTEAGALLEVIEGRDPRNWQAAENALLTRRKRMELDRRLVPVDDVSGAVSATVTMVRSALLALESQLDVDLQDCETHQQRKAAIHRGISQILDQMAATADDVTPEASAAPEAADA